MYTSPLHKSPVLIACIPLIVGIKIAQQFSFSLDSLYVYLIAFVLIAFVLQFFKIRRRSILNAFYFIILTLTFFLIGYLRFQQENKENAFDKPITAKFSATVLAIPIEKAKSYRVDLKVDSAFSDSASFRLDTKVISYIEPSPDAYALSPGQRISFTSTLNSPSEVMNPEDFNYKAFLQRKNIFATTYIKSDSWTLLTGEQHSIAIFAAKQQQRVVLLLGELNYDIEEMALLSALTVGYKQLIGDEQRQAYVASGATHVLAVSGLHVGIIFLFLSRIFKFLGNSKKMVIIRLFIIVALLWCFAFITGLSPSVTRATTMFTLISIGNAMRQRSMIFNTIFLSAIILLVYDPQYLFDIGFQLSYCAVLGIVIFQPYFSRILNEKLHLPKQVSELIAVSIAAQLGTAPLSIHVFNCFPNYFILTNIWIIPLVGIIVNTAIILIIMALVGIPVTWLAIPLEWCLKLMNGGVEYISRLPHSLTQYVYIDMPTLILLYAAILMFAFALEYHSKRYLYITLFCLLCTQGVYFRHETNDKKLEKLIVFSARDEFNICAQQGLRSNILKPEDGEFRMPSYFIHHYLARKTLSTSHFQKNYSNYNLCVKKDFIITPNELHLVYTDTLSSIDGKIRVTSLIINKEEPRNIYELFENVSFETLILFQRPEKYENYYRNFCKKNNIKLYLVYKEGAYTCAF